MDVFRSAEPLSYERSQGGAETTHVHPSEDAATRCREGLLRVCLDAFHVEIRASELLSTRWEGSISCANRSRSACRSLQRSFRFSHFRARRRGMEARDLCRLVLERCLDGNGTSYDSDAREFRDKILLLGRDFYVRTRVRRIQNALFLALGCPRLWFLV